MVEVDHTLKQEFLGKLLNYYPSMHVYSIRKLTESEKEDRIKYYASQFMGSKSIQNFTSHKEDHSTLISLPWNTKMEIFDNSNAITIDRKLNSFEHTFKNKLDLGQLSEIVTNSMKKLELDKYRLPIEHIEFETLWQIKKSGITREGNELPITLCRIEGGFRRYINHIPVYGVASIYIKIAEDSLVEAIKIDWRSIEEKPKAEVKIIRPDVAAEKILKGLNFSIGQKITINEFEPIFFDLGYYSKSKKEEQNYMQPVYIAAFQSRLSKWNMFIIIPASDPVYETYLLSG